MQTKAYHAIKHLLKTHFISSDILLYKLLNKFWELPLPQLDQALPFPSEKCLHFSSRHNNLNTFSFEEVAVNVLIKVIFLSFYSREEKKGKGKQGNLYRSERFLNMGSFSRTKLDLKCKCGT